MLDPIWGLLGIPETQDPKEIRRAYARRLKERRPDEDPQRFQELREAFETALAWSDGSQLAAPFPEPKIERSELGRRLDAAVDAGGLAAATALLDELFAEDLGLVGKENLELEIADWLRGFERPPAELIELAARHFGWLDDELYSYLPPAAQYLALRLTGYRQAFEILARARFEADPVLHTVASWLRGEVDAEAAAQSLRDSGQDRNALRGLTFQYWAAFRFEIDPDLLSWMESHLPPRKPPGLLARLGRRALALDFELPDKFGRWRFTYATFLLLAAPALLFGRAQVEPHHYLLLAIAPLLPLLMEFARAEVRRRKIRMFDGLPVAALWTVLFFAVVAQFDFRSRDYETWWVATVLAILLAYEDDPPPDLWMAAHFFGVSVFFFCPIWQVEQPDFAPFGLFFVPLLQFPGAFFGSRGPGERATRILLSVAFAAAVLAATVQPAGDARRILLGIALVLLVLLLRAYRFRLGDLIVLPLLVALAANQLGTTLAATPALLLLFLPGILLWRALAPLANLRAGTQIGGQRPLSRQ